MDHWEENMEKWREEMHRIKMLKRNDVSPVRKGLENIDLNYENEPVTKEMRRLSLEEPSTSRCNEKVEEVTSGIRRLEIQEFRPRRIILRKSKLETVTTGLGVKVQEFRRGRPIIGRSQLENVTTGLGVKVQEFRRGRPIIGRSQLKQVARLVSVRTEELNWVRPAGLYNQMGEFNRELRGRMFEQWRPVRPASLNKRNSI